MESYTPWPKEDAESRMICLYFTAEQQALILFPGWYDASQGLLKGVVFVLPSDTGRLTLGDNCSGLHTFFFCFLSLLYERGCELVCLWKFQKREVKM